MAGTKDGELLSVEDVDRLNPVKRLRASTFYTVDTNDIDKYAKMGVSIEGTDEVLWMNPAEMPKSAIPMHHTLHGFSDWLTGRATAEFAGAVLTAQVQTSSRFVSFVEQAKEVVIDPDEVARFEESLVASTAIFLEAAKRQTVSVLGDVTQAISSIQRTGMLPWVIADSPSAKKHITGELTGFRAVRSHEGLPVFEPRVINRKGHEGLLPKGFQLHRGHWLLFALSDPNLL